MLRHCKGCGVAGYEFYASIPGWCRACWREKVRVHRASKPEYYRAYDAQRAQTPERKALATRVQREWKAAHPLRRAAQITLGNAVRDGKVVPWPVCSVPECCGRPVAHHPDYSRPLDVVWLCQSHHKKAHALLKEAA